MNKLLKDPDLRLTNPIDFWLLCEITLFNLNTGSFNRLFSLYSLCCVITCIVPEICCSKMIIKGRKMRLISQNDKKMHEYYSKIPINLILWDINTFSMISKENGVNYYTLPCR